MMWNAFPAVQRLPCNYSNRIGKLPENYCTRKLSLFNSITWYPERESWQFSFELGLQLWWWYILQLQKAVNSTDHRGIGITNLFGTRPLFLITCCYDVILEFRGLVTLTLMCSLQFVILNNFGASHSLLQSLNMKQPWFVISRRSMVWNVQRINEWIWLLKSIFLYLSSTLWQ